ncbi:MAG: hypothetical protein U0K25_03560 [Streptococcus sp.]|nr:hypothetical protein [Streptococcus sp.]
MKTTTRLYDIIYTTYINIYSDFLRSNQIVYYNPELQFTHKVLQYDDEVKTLCRNTIFYGLDFLDEQVREEFETEFLAKFLTRTIKFQTYENFNWRLASFIRGIKDVINDYYVNGKKYINNNVYTYGNTTSNSTGTVTTRDNNLAVTLPQDNTDLSLDKETYDYADTTAHSKSRSNNTNEMNTDNLDFQETFEVARMRELYTFHNDLFNDLDRMLFSQIL